MSRTENKQHTAFRKSWDSDKALKSTYTGFIGRYQLRLILMLLVIYGVSESWIPALLIFNALPAKHLVCLNATTEDQNNVTAGNASRTYTQPRNLISVLDFGNNSLNASDEYDLDDSDWSHDGVLTPVLFYKRFNVSDKEKQSVLVQFGLLCGDEYKMMIARIGFIFAKHVGTVVCGYLADYVGRKLTLISCTLVCFAMLLFQILSEDFVSYCFFIVFIGLSSGGIASVTIPFILEMFPIRTRSIFGLIFTCAPYIFDLIIPWLAYGINHWKILQGVVTIPLISAAVLHWWSEESVFWYTSLKDYVGAIESLTRIAAFNGVAFQSQFKEADDFLHGKKSKGIQCDFQPLLRIQDLSTLKNKYPDIDFADIMNTRNQRKNFFHKISGWLSGRKFYPTLSRFSPLDYFHSCILLSYIVLSCALWFVNALTFTALNSHELSWRLKQNYYTGYCFDALTAICAFMVALPAVYRGGRRWPTFWFYLVSEVCLLASIVAKIEKEFTPVTLTLIYLLGKFASYGSFMVIHIFCAEIFPTGLRCTSIGICFFFRGIGLILADPDLLNFHDWTSRLVYGFLSLVIGSLALVLPETRRYPLPRTFIQVEIMPSAVSRKVRKQRTKNVHKNIVTDALNLRPSTTRVRFSNNDYDPQSTIHSFYEIHEPIGNVSHGEELRSDFDAIEEQDENIDCEVTDVVEDIREDSRHEPNIIDDVNYRPQNDDAYFSEQL